MKKKEVRNYYNEIDKALKDYEEFKPYRTRSIDWITDRIDWCWKFRHITEEQMNELADRVCKILDNYRLYDV